MLAVLLAAFVSALAVAASVRQWRRVDRTGLADAAAVERELGLGTRSGDGRAAAALLRAGCEPELGEAISGRARDVAIRVMNEHLGQVRAELEVGQDVPRVAARVALAVGVLAALVEIASGLSGPGPSVASAVRAFVAGVAGALVCFELDRRARRRAEGVREEWDRVTRALTRRLEA